MCQDRLVCQECYELCEPATVKDSIDAPYGEVSGSVDVEDISSMSACCSADMWDADEHGSYQLMIDRFKKEVNSDAWVEAEMLLTRLSEVFDYMQQNHSDVKRHFVRG